MPKLLNLWAGDKFVGKLGRQILGIFGHEKSIVLMMCLLLWECQVTQKFIVQATNEPWVKLHICEGSSPKRGVSPPFWGQKSKTIVFSNFFQYFMVNYCNRIVFHIFSILFGKILHIFSCRRSQCSYRNQFFLF